ncbi:solute carrier family 41 member 2-like [Schistocerca nitens]|uniref:solute carrier family 41 member 2-like n=1 Tax=Schistocerca nitens TaxID=7011 RepID=UPI002117BF20|nr:solute carrier family 41 member 2-like [Schistocerca nitens]XP_049805200.1 solute carrier family 41 member 2-like [Schistocerca nitens]XP_049805202.1 solute carrier family 41 member 2-like [Schistocerca nitens]
MVAYPDLPEVVPGEHVLVDVDKLSGQKSPLEKMPSLNASKKVLPDDKSPTTPGGFSLASTASIATITTVATVDETPQEKQELWYHTILQVSVPFFLAGAGTIGSGLLLGTVEKWAVFVEISSLMILVPSLTGLKGNLDMCLASRLSTQANLGLMDSRRETFLMVTGNIALVQVQAIVAAIVVAIFAVSVNAIMEGAFQYTHALLLASSSLATATTSCFVLDFVLSAVILISHKRKMNPDNLATPLAASIGDIVSLTLLANFASIFYEVHDVSPWVSATVVAFYLLLLPVWIYVVYRNKYTKPVLYSGWVPVLGALLISGFGGIVMNSVYQMFNGFVVFQPIINGIGGNLVSVQASRISTMLHKTSLKGIIPPHTKLWVWPWSALFKGLPHAATARLLILLAVIGQSIFVFIADFFHAGETTIDYRFALTYIFASLLQVMLLLYLAHLFVHIMWRWKSDPDNSAIPFLTAIGDLTGSSFLALAFAFLQAVHVTYNG